jgi:hypothetical protein
MKDIFCKLFDFEDCQVLIKKEESEDTFDIRQSTVLEGMGVDLTLIYKKEEVRDKHFDEYSDDNAKKFVGVIKSMMRE